jgi:hypothetical protein
MHKCFHEEILALKKIAMHTRNAWANLCKYKYVYVNLVRHSCHL